MNTNNKSYPLTSSQMGIYLTYIKNPKDLIYNLPVVFTLPKDTDEKRLEEALHNTIPEFSAFCTRFEVIEGEIRMVPQEPVVDIEVKQVSECDMHKIKQSFVKPFDLNVGKLARFMIVRTEKTIYLFADMHHIVCDGFSSMVFINALVKSYEGNEIRKEKITIFEVAQIEKDELDNNKYEKEYRFFEERLSQIEDQQIPSPDYPQNVMNEFGQEDSIECYLDDVITADVLTDYTKQAGLTEASTFMGIYAWALGKAMGSDNAFFCIPELGRHISKSLSAMGMFVRNIPLYVTFDEKNQTMTTYLKEFSSLLQDSISNSAYPFYKLAQKFEIKNDISFAYQGKMIAPVKFNGGSIKIERLKTGSANGKIATALYKEDNRYKLVIDYQSDLYNKDTINTIISLIKQGIKGFLADKRLCDISLIDEKTTSLLESFHGEDREDGENSVVELLRKQFNKTSENIALVSGNKKFTYEEIDDLTDRLASYLAKNGIQKGDVVAVLPNRDEMMVIAPIAILKAGAIYQPIDYTCPKERISFMLNDSNAKLLITTRELHALVDIDIKTVYSDEIYNLPECDTNFPTIDKEDGFIILYTSGSTGLPKGCMLEHGNLVSFIHTYIENVRLTDKSRVAAYASFAFDVNMQDVYATLCIGATLYIVKEEIRLELNQLNEFIETNKITHIDMTTQVGRQLATCFENNSLKLLGVGGETLTPFNPPSNYAVINNYGPTETTVTASYYPVDKLSPFVPIGWAYKNVKLYVVDKYMRRVPVGVVGELCIAGPQVARGYINNPKETKRVFINNPFTEESKYKKMYLTGDVVCFLPDGTLKFIGRNDGQVKIRGFRIELTEIEEVIRRFDGIKDATVVAFDNPAGGKMIAAYIVSDEIIDINKLSDFIKNEKPDYMVPAVIMQIDKIPLNQNYKVNKKALPKPEYKAKKIIQPENELQQKIFGLIADVLGYSNFGIDTDLFEVGLNSITSMKLVYQLSKEFDRTITVAELRDNTTIEKLEKLLLLDVSEEKFEIQEKYPLTKNQEGIYIECLKHPGSTLYNIPMLIKINKAIDVLRLKMAIRDTINAHPYLMTTLFDDEGSIYLLRDESIIFDKEEIEELYIENIDEAKGNLSKPFDLLKKRLFRIYIIHSKDELRLFIEIHHIISDGTSFNILIEDINRAYKGEIIDTEVFSGYEVSLLEQKCRKSDTYDKAKAYYEGLFAGCDASSLPSGDSPLSNGTQNIIIESKQLTIKNTALFCNNNRITANALFSAAFGYTLAKYQNDEQAIFTTIYNGRNDSRLQRCVSMIVKNYPLLCNTKEDNCIDYIKRIGNQINDSTANDIYSFAEISQTFGINTEVLFAYQGEEFELNEFCGKKCETEIVDIRSEKAPLAVHVFISQNKYYFVVDYDKALFSDEYIKQFINIYEKVLLEIMRVERLSDISFVDAKMEEKLNAFHGEERNDIPCSVTELLQKQFAKTPDNIAVVSKDKRLTYKELDEITDRLASYLVKLGIGKEDVVAIMPDRDEMMVICPVAVIKAGAIYQPLDSTYPNSRLSFMIDNSNAKLLITTKELSKQLDTDTEILYIEDIKNLPVCDINLPESLPSDGFGLLYTSGTTGTPKGIIIEHYNLVSLIRSYIDRVKLNDKSKVAEYASFGFVINMQDTYPALCVGATIYIVPLELRLDLIRLNQYFEENNITHVHMTAQVGRQFALSVKNNSLQNLGVGGESLTPFEPPKDYRVVNNYGSTECTANVATFTVDKFYKSVPIGKAYPNVRLYVLDKQLRKMPIGMPGELCVAGPYVARGYFNDLDATKEAFIDNPFTYDLKYQRLYKTGDIVCFMPDGKIAYIGRNDSQVKVRGFRIELTEVEEVIRRFDDIKDATVTVFDAKTGGKMLVAYVVSDNEINTEKLSDFIRNEKPDYMVPSVIMQIDKMPLNQNLKVNKKALPKPQRGIKYIVKPQNEIQQKIFELVAEIIEFDDFGIRTNFYDIGLSSISSIKLLFGLSKTFDRTINIVELRENNTIEKLEKLLMSDIKEEKFEVQEKYPLTKNQEGVYVECLKHPNTAIYNIPMLLKISKALDVLKLKNAIVEAINAHPYLMMSLENEKGYIKCIRNLNKVFTSNDIEELHVSNTDETKEILSKPIDLTSDRLFRICLIYYKDELRLFMNFHHIIFDGTSRDILIEDINNAYQGQVVKREVYSGYEVALHEQKLRNSKFYDEAKEYYHDLFKEFIAGGFPKGDDPKEKGYKKQTIEAKILEGERVSEFCDKYKTTENALFSAAFGYVLARYQNNTQASFTTIYNGRNDSRLERCVSMIVKNYPLLCNTGENNCINYIKKIEKQINDSTAYDIYSFAEINKAFGINTDVLFVYQGDRFEVTDFCGEKCTRELIDSNNEEAPLALHVYKVQNKYWFILDYDNSKFSDKYMEELASVYEKALFDMMNVNYLSDIRISSTNIIEKTRKADIHIEESAKSIEEKLLPQNEVQQKVFDIISEILGYCDFGINSDFYEAGLDSISSMRVLYLISEKFQRTLSMAELKENSTVAKMEELLNKVEIKRVYEISDEYPINMNQNRFFVACYNNQHVPFNMTSLALISNNIDIDRLKNAIAATINTHYYVMTTLSYEDGRVSAIRDRNLEYTTDDIEMLELEDIKETVITPFKLLNSRLFRISLIKSKGNLYMYASFHHIIMDGTSVSILMEDINKAYAGEELEEEQYTGYEVALYERDLRESDTYVKAKEYYTKLFNNCKAKSAPSGDNPDAKGYNKEYIKSTLLRAEEIKTFCRNNKITENTLFSAAFGLTLAKYHNEDEAVFATLYNGRNDSRLKRSISLLIKNYPLLCDTKDKECLQYIKVIGENIAKACENDIYTCEEIYRESGIVANAHFIYQGDGFATPTFCGEKYQSKKMLIDKYLGVMPAYFTFHVIFDESYISFLTYYANSIYSNEYINKFARNYEKTILGLMQKQKLSDIILDIEE